MDRLHQAGLDRSPCTNRGVEPALPSQPLYRLRCAQHRLQAGETRSQFTKTKLTSGFAPVYDVPGCVAPLMKKAKPWASAVSTRMDLACPLRGRRRAGEPSLALAPQQPNWAHVP